MLRQLKPQPNQQESLEINNYLIQDSLPIFLSKDNQPNHQQSEDIIACESLIEKLIKSQEEIKKKSINLVEGIQEKTFQKGIGYYNAKNLLFMEYLIHLKYYELFKVNAVDFTKGTGLSLYQRLVYLKTLLLKLGPIQKKLEYQTNKILKYSEIIQVQPDIQQDLKSEEEREKSKEKQQKGVEVAKNGKILQNDQSQEQEDALAYQPRPNILFQAKKSKDLEGDREGKYVAPKISSNLSKDQIVKRRIENQKDRKKAFLIRKFRDDLVENDYAQQQGVDNELAEKIKRKFQEKTNFEEENFVRFGETKKEKFWRKSLMKNQFKNNQLEDDFKEIKMIKQIFNEDKEGHEAAPFAEKKRHAPKSNFQKREGTKRQKQ